MAKREEVEPPRQREPDTLWKLVDARCAQLADAVANARIPFLIALTWSFIWAWAIYSVDVGYLRWARDDARAAYALSLANKDVALPQLPNAIARRCEQAVPAQWRQAQLTEATRRQVCFETIKTRFEWTEKAFADSLFVSFPGGYGKITVSDLGVVGQVGLLLILSWLFFAARRENHAVRAIVDRDRVSREAGRKGRENFILVPQGRYLSAEHYAYAYHSVAQRFMFLFSEHSRPLMIFTWALCAIPPLVAFWNVYPDIRDMLARPQWELHLIIRVAVEVVIFVCVCVITCLIVRFERDTSIVLNGWYLAARDVWDKDWDETTQEPAKTVAIDVQKQQATPKDLTNGYPIG